MAERTSDLPIFAARQRTFDGISSSEVLDYPPSNFPNSEGKASDWGKKWGVWQATTPDIYPDPVNSGGLSGQDVVEAFVQADNGTVRQVGVLIDK